jgi:hypothetical protein
MAKLPNQKQQNFKKGVKNATRNRKGELWIESHVAGTSVINGAYNATHK